MQIEAKSLKICSIEMSISPIVGIASTQRHQLKDALTKFKDEIKKATISNP
jgi:hypothetical protein